MRMCFAALAFALLLVCSTRVDAQSFHLLETTATLSLPCRLTVETDVPIGTLIEADLVVHNPSLLFPFDVGFLNGGVSRLNDSTFRVAGTTTSDKFHVFSETLAGSDSITSVCLNNIVVNGELSTAATCSVVSVISTGTPLPYVRFAWLGKPYPNPAKAHQDISLPYRLDIASDVTFSVYSLSGNQLVLQEHEFVDRGYHTFTFQLTDVIASGWYFVVMESGSGTAQQIVVYLR